MNNTEIINQNIQRNKEINATYDPITGRGSLTSRFEFKIDEDRSLFLPVTMKEDKGIREIMDCGSLEMFISKNFDDNKEDVMRIFITQLQTTRMSHDFELWAYTTIKIKDKHSGKPIPFLLNRPQRKLVKVLMWFVENFVPIRIIIGKARQWGGSTVVQFFFVWIQLLVKDGWSSSIIADVESQANNIRSMIRSASVKYPRGIGVFKLAPFEGSTKHVELVERGGCVIYVASMQRPDSIRSSAIYLAHLTETAFWKKTEGKSPEDVIQTVVGSVPALPFTAVVIESTAKGVGNYFYNQYTSAKSGKSDYRHFFASWFDNERNVLAIDDYVKFVESMDEYEQYLFTAGATLEGIAWYRYKKRTDYSGSQELMWRIFEELPSDDNEMFQSSGSRVFPRQFVVDMENGCRKALRRGDIKGDNITGVESINGIEFVDNPTGYMQVWIEPDDSPEQYAGRYVVVVDIGGKSITSDNSVITVFDNLFTSTGGCPEVCATWVGHIDQDVLAWKAVQICSWFHDALLVIENNSLNRDEMKSSEGSHFETVLNEIVDHYDNIYCTQQNITRIKEGRPAVYGFNTNKATKPTIINTLYKCLRDRLYYEYEIELCSELDTYELKPDGTYGAKDKCHDDRLMTRAIGLWVCYNDAPAPQLKTSSGGIRKKQGGVSTF